MIKKLKHILLKLGLFIFLISTISCSSRDIKKTNDTTLNKSSKTYTKPSDELGVLNVMTYNILWDKTTTGDYQWSFRRQGLINLVERHNPDLIGIQEGFLNQVKDIATELSYKFFGYGTDDGKGESDNPGRYQSLNPIVYNPDRLKLLEKGVFWYSNDPEHPNIGYSVSHFRNCVWGKFREIYKSKKGDIIYVFNTHLSLTDEVRIKQVHLLRSKIKEIAGEDAIVLAIGDFNSDPVTNKSYDALIDTSYPTPLIDSKDICSTPLIGPDFTGSGIIVNSRKTGLEADHIFIRNISLCTSHKIITDYEGDKYPSDHFPVLAVLSYKH